MNSGLGLGAAVLALTVCVGCGDDGPDRVAVGGDAAGAAPATSAQASPPSAAAAAAQRLQGAQAPVQPCTGVDRGAVASSTAGESRLPELTLECLAGGDPITLSELRGPLVLNVWASWCGPCGEELPHLLAAAQEFGTRVDFLGLAISDKDASSREWLSFHGVPWPSVADPDAKIRAPMRIPGPPVSLFVRSDGTIAEVHYGAFTSAQQVSDLIARHLAVA